MARTRNRRLASERKNDQSLRKSKPVQKRVELSDFLLPDSHFLLPDFLDSLGLQGISEVFLYRILPSGKQQFITSGSPTQFSEKYVQAEFGEGDYLARAKLNGRWYKSISFSVEAARRAQ